MQEHTIDELINYLIETNNNDTIKELPPYNGTYWISDRGEVISMQGTAPRVLKPFKNQSGYFRVSMYQDGVRKDELVSRLVAGAFIPVDSPEMDTVHHKNRDKANNSVANLQWLTIQENIKRYTEENKKAQQEREKYAE